MSCTLKDAWKSKLALKAYENVIKRLDNIKVENDAHGDVNYTKALIAFKKREITNLYEASKSKLQQNLEDLNIEESAIPKTGIDDEYVTAWEGNIDSEVNDMFAKQQVASLKFGITYRSAKVIKENALFNDIDFTAREAEKERRRKIALLSDYEKTEPYKDGDPEGVIKDGDLVWLDDQTFGIFNEGKDKAGRKLAYFTEIRNGKPVEGSRKKVKRAKLQKRKSRRKQQEDTAKRNNENNKEGSGGKNLKGTERSEKDEEQLEDNKDDKSIGKPLIKLPFYQDDNREGFMNLVNLITGRDKFKSALYKFFNSRSRKDLKNLKVYYSIDESTIPSELKEKFDAGNLSLKDISESDTQNLIENLKVYVEVIDKDGKSIKTELYNWNEYSQETFGEDIERNETPNLIQLFSNILVLSSANKLVSKPKKIFGRIEYSTWGTFTNEIVETIEDSQVIKEPVFTNITKLIYKGIGKAKKQIGTIGILRKGVIYSEGKYYPVTGETVSDGSAFVLFQDPVEGTIIPVKVSGRNLNKKEATEIFRIAAKLITSIPNTEDSFTMRTVYEDSNLTAKEYLSLLTFITDKVDNEGKLILDRNWSMGFQQARRDKDGNLIEDSLFVYGKDENGDLLTITISDFKNTETLLKAKEDFIKYVTENKKRHLLAEPLENEEASSLFDAFEDSLITEFKFLGKKYTRKQNKSYLDFVLEQEILQTDIVLVNGRVQKNRQVVVGNTVQFEEEEDTSETKNTISIDNLKKALKKIQDRAKKFTINKVGNYSFYKIGKTLYERQTAFLQRALGQEAIDQTSVLARGAAVGNIVDDIGRLVFAGKDREEILKSVPEFIKNAWKDIDKNLIDEIDISDKVINTLIDEFEALRNELETKGFTIISEDILFSLDFEEAFKDDTTGKKFKGVAGVLDTLLIDDKGNLHILDFKNIRTSEANFADALQSYDRLTKYTNQQTVYKYLAEQNGYNISSINILPILANYEFDGLSQKIVIKSLKLHSGLAEKSNDNISEKVLKLTPNKGVVITIEDEFKKKPVPPSKPEPEPESQEDVAPDTEENVDDLIDPLAVSEVEEDEYGSGNVQKDLEFLKKAFGDRIPVHILEKVFKIGERGADLFAAFYRGAVYLSEEGVLGQGAHEAMHVVEKLFLTAEELAALNRETYSKYYKKGTEATRKAQRKFLEEKLKEIQDKAKASYGVELTEQEALGKHLSELRAEELRALTIENDESGIGKKTLNFLRYQLEKLFALFKDPSARLVYERIARGYYKEAPVVKRDNTVRYSSFWSSQEKDIDESQRAFDNLNRNGFSKRDLDRVAHYMLYSILYSHKNSSSKKEIKSIKDFGLEEGDTLIFDEEVFEFFIESLEQSTNNSLEKLKNLKANPGKTPLKKIDKAIAKTENQLQNLKLLKENIKYFYNNDTKKGYLITFLNKLGLKASITEEDIKKEKNKDVTQAVRSHFETSQKDNARFRTKLMLSFLLRKNSKNKAVRDPKTNMFVLENPTLVWQKTHALLSGIVSYFDNDGVEQYVQDLVIEKLEIAAKNDLIIREVLEELKALTQEKGKVDPSYQLADFIVSVQNVPLNFLSGLVNILPDNLRESIFYDPVVNSQSFRVRNSWIENLKQLKLFTYDEKEDSFILNKTVAEKAAEAIDTIEALINEEKKRVTNIVKNLSEQDKYKENEVELSSEFLENLSKELLKVGIKMTPEALDYMINSKLVEIFSSKETTANTWDRLHALWNGIPYKGQRRSGGLLNILKSTKSKTPVSLLQFILNPSKLDYRNNNHLANRFSYYALKPFVESVVATDQENVEQVVSGAEGKLKYLYGLSNYMHIRLLELQRSSEEVERSLRSSWSVDSDFLNQIKKGARPVIRTFESLKVNNGKDLGTEAKNLDTASDHSTRVNLVLKKNPFIPLPTMAEKPIWSLLEGLDLNRFDIAKRDNTFRFIREKNEDGTWKSIEEAEIRFGEDTIQVFADFAVKELERVRKVHKQLFGTNKLTDKQLIDTYHYRKEKEGKKDRNTARALEFIIFPLLNDEAVLKEIGWKDDEGNFLENADSLKQDKYLNPRIEEVLRERVIVEIKDAIDKGTIKETENGLTNALISKGIINDANSKFQTQDEAIAYTIANYGVKSLVSFIESTMLYANDPAFYSSLKNYTKRHPGIIAPGTTPFIIDPKNSTFNVAVIKDFVFKSERLEAYRNKALEELKKKAVYKNATALKKKELEEAIKVAYSPYERVNATDGQGYISFERWRYLMEGLGLWDPNNTGKWDAAFERLNDPNQRPDPEDLSLLIAQPIKGQHFENRFEKYLGSEVPTYLKYSQAPLIPAVVSGTSLGSLAEKMKREGVDEVVFASAIKVGALSPIDTIDSEGNFIDNIPFNSFTLQNKYWRLQQQLTPHTESDTMVGSQMQKMILADFKASDLFELGDVEYTGREMRKLAHSIDRTLSDIERDIMFKEWGIDVNENKDYRIADFNKFSKVLISTFKNKASTPSKLIESLQPNKQGTDFVVPLDVNYNYRDQINSTIASMITDRLINLKTKGNSLIQMSGWGFTPVKGFKDLTAAQKNTLKNNTFAKRLQPVRMEGNKVLAAQVYLPHRFKKVLKEAGIDTNNSTAINNFVKNKKLFQAVGYRIPTQGLSSIEALEAIGFLDESMGDTIVVYNELTAKTGADFDIDKLFIMLPEFEVRKGKPEYVKWYESPNKEDEIEYNRKKYRNTARFKKALRNRKIDLYFSILTSPNSFVRLTNPLDSITLKNASAEIQYLEAKANLTKEEINEIEKASVKDYYDTVTKILESKNDLEWFSPSNQLFIKESYQSGQRGVGQKANHSSDHSISQDTIEDYEELESPLYFSDWMGIGARTESGKTDLSNIDDVNGNLISSLLSARLDGFLDIANDDYITKLNDVATTSNLYSLLDRAGIDPMWTNKFMSSPILKQWVKRTRFINSPVTELPVIDGVTITTAEQEARLLLSKKFFEEDTALANNESIVKIEGEVKTLIDLDLTKESNRKAVASILGIPFVENQTSIDNILTTELLTELLDSSNTEVEHRAFKELMVLDTFMSLKSRASYLNTIVIASKHDTNGAYKGLIGSLHAMNLKDAINENKNYKILGFEERFEGTSLGKYEEHGPKLMIDLLKQYSILGEYRADEIIYKIAEKVGKEYTAKSDEEFFKGMYNSLISYILSETPYFKSIDIESLLYGENAVAKELWKYQNNEDSPIKENLFIKSLKVETALEGKSSDINYISFDATEVREGIDKDDLTRHWQDLFNHEDEKVRDFAKRLFDFSLVSAGFYKTVSSFTDLAPLQVELDTNMYEDFKVIASGLSMDDITTRAFLKSNVNNTKIVPEYYYTKLNNKDKTVLFLEKADGYKTKKFEEGELDAVSIQDAISYYSVRPIITVSKYNKRLKIKEAPVEGEEVGYAMFAPVIEVPGLGEKKNERYTYELVGYDENKNPLYQITEKFGQHTRNRIFEGSPEKSSIINNRFNIRIRKEGQLEFTNLSNLDKQKETIEDIKNERLSATLQEAEQENALITGEEPGINEEYTERPESGSSFETSFNPIDLEDTIFADKLSGVTLQPFYLINDDGTVDFYNSFDNISDEKLEEAFQAAVRENLSLQETLLSFTPRFESTENPVFAEIVNNTKDMLMKNTLYIREFGEERLPMKPAKVILAESTAVQKLPALKVIYDLILSTLNETSVEVVLVEGLIDKYGKKGAFFTNTNEPSTRGILLIDNSLSKDVQAITVLHEVLHKFTVEEIYKNPEFRAKIKAIFNVYQEKVTSPANKTFADIIENNKDKGIEGEDLILSEFITYGLTDEVIVDQLKKINSWGKFVEVIKELFSPLFGQKKTNAHDLLVSAVRDFIETGLSVENLEKDVTLTNEDILSVYEGIENIENAEMLKDVLKETSIKYRKICD